MHQGAQSFLSVEGGQLVVTVGRQVFEEAVTMQRTKCGCGEEQSMALCCSGLAAMLETCLIIELPS